MKTEKHCKYCNTTKPIDEFYIIKAIGHDNHCKDCRKKRNKQYMRDNPGKFVEIRNRHSTGEWLVYMLPDHQYVGYTCNLEYRMNNHRHDGKNTDNVKVLHRFHRKDFAMLVEDGYHSLGWLGGQAERETTKGRFWITDGKTNRMIKTSEIMPYGFRKGMTRHLG